MSYVSRLRQRVGTEPLFLVGSRAIIIDSLDRVLLHLRTDFKGIWSLPGKQSEIGESLYDTIHREVREEVGIVMKNCQMFGISQNPALESFEYPNGDSVQLVASCFFATEWAHIDGTAPDAEEVAACDFYHFTDLPTMRPNERLTLEAFLVYRATQKFQVI